MSIQLTQDTILERDKSTRTHHIQKSEEVSPFPTGDHNVAINMYHRNYKHTQKKNKHKNHRLGTVSKKITGEFKLSSWYQPLPYFWCESRHIDVWFEFLSPTLSMNYLLEHINQDYKKEIKQRKGLNFT